MSIETWIGLGAFVITVGGVIWKLAIAIDRVTVAVRGMSDAQKSLWSTTEAHQVEILDHKGILRDHSDTLERHDGQLTKHEGKITAAGKQIAVLADRSNHARGSTA